MKKPDREAMARIDGMAYALRQIKENGVEYFEKELEYRTGKGFTIPLTQKEVGRYYKEALKIMQNRVCLCALYALRDEFGFGSKRGVRFFQRFYDYLQSVGDDYVTWKEIEEAVGEEMGISIDSYK